jgi:PAS domain S-box-containing protein
MNSLIPLTFDPRQLRRATGLILALWTLAVIASVVWNVHLLHNAMLDAADRDARNSFDRDRLYLLNPNNMTREAHELKSQEDGTLGHITSLKPLRRENTPDAWEAAALRSFEQGRTEASSREVYQGQPYLRFMKPLVTEASCLKCHAVQGYHKGDIRGGISVAVPLDPYLDLAQAQFGHIAGTHAGLWSLGLLGIFLGGRQMRQRLDKQLQAEEALRRSETKFRTLYDSTRDAVMLLDTKGFFDCNPAALTMFGCASREEFCSKHPADVSPLMQPDGTDSLKRANQGIATALKKGTDHFEWMHKRVDTGETFTAEVLLSAMELDGKPVLQAVVRDITGRKRTEDKLRQLSRAVEQSPASIVITNPAGDIEYVNPKFIEVTGYTSAEVLGKNPRVLKSGEKSPEAYRELWETIAAGKEWSGEFHNKKKNGELFWESASISPIRDPAGRVTHYVAVKEDITARKQNEAERDKLILDLQDALASVKSLSGLLPICAGCKKIRDDKGYWSQVEKYIQKHSEATFTHSLCPDCLKKLYPDLVEAGLGDSSKKAP